VAKVGSVEVTRETPKTVWFSPVAAGLALAAGIVLTVVGARSPARS